MIFITSLLVVMRYFGVLPDERVKNIRITEVILFLVCSTPMMFVLIPSIVYLIVFYDSINVLDLTDLIHTICIFGCNWSSYLIIAMNQIRFRRLIDELRLFVAKRECCAVPHLNLSQQIFCSPGQKTASGGIYVETAILLDKICIIYTVACVIGVLGVFLMPFVKPFYHYLIGSYSFASWYTPYKTM